MGSSFQHRLNKQIEEMIQEGDEKGKEYKPDEIAFFQQYEGSGGQGKEGATGEGILYEFYTPDYIVDLMWGLARYYGYEGGSVLDPGIGTGRLVKLAPNYADCVGFEINPISARIAEIACKGCTVHKRYFETAFLEPPRYVSKLKNKLTWLKEYPFSLVIGNPPFGIYQNEYSSHFPEAKKLKQTELFFMYKCLQLLKEGGLLVFLTGSSFLRNGDSYNRAKDELATMAVLLDAYRLPPVFKFSQVPTDIIVLKKK